MKQTEDILANLPRTKPKQIVVGFALETENLLENALKKLHKKKLDLVVGNNPLQEGSGFGTATNEVMLISRDGSVEGLPLLSKREVAREILGAVVRLWHEKQSEIEQPKPAAKPHKRRATSSARRKSAKAKKTRV